MSPDLPSLEQEPPSQLPGARGPVSVFAILLAESEWLVDNGALHGRARIEKGFRYSEDPDHRGRGDRIKVVWAAMDQQDPRSPFVGLVSNEFWLDVSTRTGFKQLSTHANGICNAASGKVDLAILEPGERASLRQFLERIAPASWGATESRLKLFLMA